jgi:hypothetical protein
VLRPTFIAPTRMAGGWLMAEGTKSAHLPDLLKVEIVEKHMRFRISQERLNGLATICIEKKLLDEIDIIINDFASRIVRRNF